MQNFENLISKIFNYTHEYGINNLPFNYNKHISNWGENQKKLFMQYVHKGFRISQDLILQELISLQKENQELKDNLKQFKRERNNEKIKELENLIHLNIYKESILRSFTDFIAWQFLNQQYYKVRRFFNSKEKGKSRPYLNTSNIESVIQAVKYYHNESPLNFALISDLTSFIDIGDLLIMKNYEVIPIELKEGKINEEVFEVINKFPHTKIDDFPIDKIENQNEHFLKQVKRVLNQKDRENKLINFLKKEEGVDPFSNLTVEVNKEPFNLEYFTSTVNDLILTLNEKNWAYTVFEDVITIGVYQKEHINMGDNLIPLLNKSLYGKDFPVMDFIEKLNIPITKPIYYIGLSKKLYLIYYFVE